MQRNSLVFALSGTFFGLLVGWIIGSQSAGPAAATPGPVAAASAATTSSSTAPPSASARIAELESQAAARPGDIVVRVELGNLYFDGERFDLAVPWYEAALELNAEDVNVSTDLAVSYYYTNQADRALVQLDRSLEIDPGHLKTLVNQGIIRAFGKEDLAGAAESWQRVVALAPDSEEGRRAQQGLDGLRAAHAGTDAGSPPTSDSP